MRIISSDGAKNVAYENVIIQMVEYTDDPKAYIVSITNRGSVGLGEYPIERAKEIFEEIIEHGNLNKKVYRMPKEVNV